LSDFVSEGLVQYSESRQNSASFWISFKAFFTAYFSRFTPRSLFDTSAPLEESEADDAREAQTTQWGNPGSPYADVHLSPDSFNTRPRTSTPTSRTVLWAFQRRIEFLDKNRRMLDRLHPPHQSKNTGAEVHIQAIPALHRALARLHHLRIPLFLTRRSSPHRFLASSAARARRAEQCGSTPAHPFPAPPRQFAADALSPHPALDPPPCRRRRAIAPRFCGDTCRPKSTEAAAHPPPSAWMGEGVVRCGGADVIRKLGRMRTLDRKRTCPQPVQRHGQHAGGSAEVIIG
jgi:hypothetical protein